MCNVDTVLDELIILYGISLLQTYHWLTLCSQD